MVACRLFLAFCGLTSGCGPNPEPPVRIGGGLWPGYECFFIARSLGLFEQHPVKLVEYPAAPETIRAFQNGAIELACVSSDEFIRLANEQPDVRAILVLDVSLGADALLSQPGVEDLASLRGRRVGVEVNAVGVFMLSRALQKAGLTRQDIEIVPLENHLHEEAFQNGSVDALVTFEPHRSRLLNKGATLLFDSAAIPGEVMDVLVTRRGLINTRPDLLRQVVKAWFGARSYFLTNALAAAEIAALRESCTPETFLKSMDLLHLPTLEENRRMLLTETNQTLNTFKNIQTVMLQAGLGEYPLSGTEYLNGSLLP